MRIETLAFDAVPAVGVRALLIGGFEPDRVALRSVFRLRDWRLDYAPDLHSAEAFLNDPQTGVVLCDTELPDGDWSAALRAAQLRPHPPRFIVTTRVADETLYREVLLAGAHDVLPAPYDHTEAVLTVSMAWTEWTRDREGRMLPAKSSHRLHPEEFERRAIATFA